MDKKNEVKLIVPMGGTGTVKPLEIEKKSSEDSEVRIVILPAGECRKDSF